MRNWSMIKQKSGYGYVFVLCNYYHSKKAFTTSVKYCVLHWVSQQRLLVPCLQPKGDMGNQIHQWQSFNCLFAHFSFLFLLEDEGARKHQFGYWEAPNENRLNASSGPYPFQNNLIKRASIANSMSARNVSLLQIAC